MGRIYQQTFVDTYSKWAAAKIYSVKRRSHRPTCSTTKCYRPSKNEGWVYCASCPRHRVLRQSRSARLRAFPGVNDIDHTKTKARYPQTNGICERFHKTVLQEFYQVASGRRSIDRLTSCNGISMFGLTTTIPSAHMWAKFVADVRP